MAEELNTFFASSFTWEDTDNITDPDIQFHGSIEEKLTDINITPELVKNMF